MNVEVQLLNSAQCLLDSRLVGANDDDTLSDKIKWAIQAIAAEGVFYPGDTIRIVEVQ